MTKTAAKAQCCNRPKCAVLCQTITAAMINPSPTKSPMRIPIPPASQAPGTGGIDINTPANPPRAAKPIKPKLTSPAYPHWIFTPNVMMAEIRQRLIMVKATFQLCTKPTKMINAVMTAKRIDVLFVINRSIIISSSR